MQISAQNISIKYAMMNEFAIETKSMNKVVIWSISGLHWTVN